MQTSLDITSDALTIFSPITGQPMDYTRFAGFRGGRGGARGGFGSAMPLSRVPDGSRTPVGVPQGGRTPAWEMASGSRSKRHSREASGQAANTVQPQHMEARQPARRRGSKTACLADVRQLTAAVEVQPLTPTMGHEQRMEVVMRVVCVNP